MEPLYHRSLPLLITGSTGKQLACQLRYLKIKNEFLRFRLRFPQSASVPRPYAIFPTWGDARYDAFELKKALLKSRQLGLLLGMSSGQCLSLFPS